MMIDKTALDVLKEFGTKYSDGVIIFDNLANRIVYCNGAAQEITGLLGSSSIGDIQELINTMPADDQAYLNSRFISLKETTSIDQIEISIHRLNASKREICVSGYTLMNDSVTMVFVQDITKNKEHERYLVEFGTKKNTTLDGVVHFISGAVTLMRNLSDGAGRSMRDKNVEGINAYLDLIDKNANHCLEVINNLLEEEHGKSANLTIKTSRTDIVEKVGYILENLRMAFPDRTFNLTRSSETIYINVDEIKLLQIVNNLASNAIKFSPPDKAIIFDISELASRIKISVSDRGIGIPPKLQPHIFDRNSSAGRYGLNGEQSFGKGLSICKTLANLLHAELSFHSVPGQGSVFFVSLPKDPNSER